MTFRSICQLTSVITALAGFCFMALPTIADTLIAPGGWLESHTLLARNIGLIALLAAFCLFLMRVIRSAVLQQSLAAGCSIVLIVAGAGLAYAILTGQVVPVAMPELIDQTSVNQLADSSDAPVIANSDAARQAAGASVHGLFWAVVALLCFNGVAWGVSVMPGESRRHRQWR